MIPPLSNRPHYHPNEYDNHGQLRLPWLFWVIVVLQAKTWALFIIAGASRETGNALLTLFYPSIDDFWFGMSLGLPAVFLFLLAGRRQNWPKIWQMSRFLLPCMLFGDLLMLLKQAIFKPADFALPNATLLMLTVWALAYVLRSKRLAAAFTQQKTDNSLD
ncbi:MAG: DUF2919 domain-containing protein [Plesiomonas sp.]|uniref:DUF2919 domain-containing protein n=1 Tax=Plesiomonas sp. TaxID=2486279 RepID=UPI003F36FB1C